MKPPALLLVIGPTLVIRLMAEEGAAPVSPSPSSNYTPTPFRP